MIINNKKSKRIIIIISLGALLFGIIMLSLFLKNTKKIIVDGNPVDNNVNNLMAFSSFARVGDTLYYSDVGDFFSYGLYRIDERGTKRLLWDGPVVSVGKSYPIKVIDGKLYCVIDGVVMLYDSSNDTFSKATNFKDYFEMKDGIMVEYIFSHEEDIHELSFKQNGKTLKNIESVYFPPFFIYDDYIYYNVNCDNVIRRYGIKDMSEESFLVLEDSLIEKIVFSNNSIIFLTYDKVQKTDRICCVDILDPDKTIYTITSQKYLNPFIVYNDKVYISTYDGHLYNYDLVTKETFDYCKKDCILECFIVDDKWIYFIEIENGSDNRVLWRITQDGKIIEKVFK